MSKTIGILIVVAVVVIGAIMWGTGIYNNLVGLDENVTQSWSQVENQYQRRADLIPNLVNTVKGVADFEKETYTAVTEARSKVSQINMSPEMLSDPNAFAQFQAAQDNLSGALSRLLVTVENYPQLKANENFSQLQAQLEGTENRISVERKKFNEVVQNYNTTIRQFPGSIIAGFTGFVQKQYFKSVAGSDVAPKVEF
ncbi:MAG: LemA family protein [Ignavibacteriales bacterium]|nr:LemA family protein [Ignavibacteriota bacterium]MCB0746693.1 LemA family protein [Ignavibacteriota bacterium]MCB9247926.1 LemA family protein [Ignavibacteriales bacterium]